ncbi:hypothetical protein BHE74_00053810, partial [Ensete ventricosum]
YFRSVIAVDSGKRAMEVLGLTDDKAEHPTVDDQKVDIILTDYSMPEMTGYDLLKTVKRISRFVASSYTKLIMCSSHGRCRAIGAEDFILKPLQTNDVLRLRSYARPTELSPRTGTKRKMTLELTAENGGSDRRPRLTGLAVS